MSKFSDFYKKITTDKALGEEFNSIIKAHNFKPGATFADLDDATIKDLEPLGKKAGIVFTFEEVKAFLARKPGGELSEDELEAVAGGKGSGGNTTKTTTCGQVGTNLDVTVTL
ncbi:MAG: hypothetical protein LBS75_10190 [Synergistaceae bacterium]|jgi:hypothetical protein|nr:hypothetical protein [Synergistaceae bacterium]